MQIKVEENRKIYNLKAEGTQNENNVTKLNIEVPKKYEDFNKKIVFITDDGTIWDIIENDTYKLTKAVTKYKSIRFYIWLTKDDIDFRTEEKLLVFNSNTNAEDNLTEEEIGGINKLLNEVSAIKEKVDTLEVGDYDDTEIKQSIQDLNLNKADKQDIYTKDEIEEKIASGEFKGKDGLSAYEIAIENGFEGTKQEWLLSLKGQDGKNGIDGKDGVNGADGKDGQDGQNGTDGVDGKSAYEIAVDNGFIGTEQEWLNSLRGETTNAKKGHIYGIRRNIESSDSSWERIWDSVGLEANATKDGMEVKNDFDNIYPWSDIITYNYNTTTHKITAFIGEPSFKFNGSNGEVMTRFPEFWYKREQIKGENGNTYEYIYIADYAEEGFEKSEQFSLSRYTVSGTTAKLSSKSAIGSLVGVIPQNFRNATKLLGNNWASLDIKHWSVLQLLYLVEYANYNVQSALGKGATQVSGNESLINGKCDFLGMKSGCRENDGTNSIIYRGIENIFGNLWQFIDGINIKNFNAYVCYDIENYASDVFSNNYKQLGYINSSETVQFTKKVGYDKNNSLIQMPIAGGGSSDTCTGDCYWCSTGNRVVWAGGNWRDGDYAGLWCLDCSEASDITHEYRGYRLLLVEGGEINESA